MNLNLAMTLLYAVTGVFALVTAHRRFRTAEYGTVAWCVVFGVSVLYLIISTGGIEFHAARFTAIAAIWNPLLSAYSPGAAFRWFPWRDAPRRAVKGRTV